MYFAFHFLKKCFHYYYAYYCHNYFESHALNIVVLCSILDLIKFLDFVDNKV